MPTVFPKHSLRLNQRLLQMSLLILTHLLFSGLNSERLRAQTINSAQVPNPPNPPPGLLRPAPALPPPQNPPVLPPPQDLLQPSPNAPPPKTPETVPSEVPGTIIVERFEVVGSTVFSRETLAKATAQFTQKPISFAELLQASAAITKLYTDKGYVTSGASIPYNQTFRTKGGVVRIQAVEGKVENIQVTGTGRLNPNYVHRRLAIAISTPFEVNRLLEALRLLQLNPLIKNISAELAAGSRPGTSLLKVKIAEASTFSAQFNLNNNREPSVGTFERQFHLNEADLLGQGDDLRVAYDNTDGSNGVEASYTMPFNPRNGTLQLSYTNFSSHVVEPPFNTANIRGSLQDFELTLRQPVVQTSTQEIALGLTAARRVSDIGFIDALTGGRLGFPYPGADSHGNTRLAVVRFFQEYTQRNSKQVIAVRSQFSVGVGAFDATLSKHPPDSRFFTWRGQAQLVRLLAPDTLFSVRAYVQLADRALVPLEQIGVGGQETVRGYRQDLLLTDNAFVASAELRLPILRVPKVSGVLQIVPFVDLGTAWNSSGMVAPNPNTIASAGVGLQWQQGNRLTARLDYGIPMVPISSRTRTLQEQGLYFSVVYNLFSF